MGNGYVSASEGKRSQPQRQDVRSSRFCLVLFSQCYSNLVNVPPRAIVKSNGPVRPATRRVMPGKQRTSKSASSLMIQEESERGEAFGLTSR